MFLVQPDKCPCCKSVLHHCERCWNKYHSGLKDKDYIPPAYYGEPMFDLDEWLTGKSYHQEGFKPDSPHRIEQNKRIAKMALEMMPIKPDKSREYREGDYNHPSLEDFV